jgi:hypothetical protein
VLGGGAPGPLTNLHAEIYYPSYLYNSSNEFRPRPVISSAPSTITIGQQFSVVSDTSSITRVTLIKTGSVTHSVNMEQRFLELPFTQASTTSFVEAPDSLTDAPPGYYLLFLINNQGVPSVASIVRLVGTSGPASDETPMVGGSGGSDFPPKRWQESSAMRTALCCEASAYAAWASTPPVTGAAPRSIARLQAASPAARSCASVRPIGQSRDSRRGSHRRSMPCVSNAAR